MEINEIGKAKDLSAFLCKKHEYVQIALILDIYNRAI
jgi:hypothetical protein